MQRTARGLRHRLCALALLVLAAGRAEAHGGLSIDDDLCKLRVGPFNMHFTGYQPQANGNREFCEDIPATGPTIVVMDALEPDLRRLPIEVRIIREPADPNAGNLSGAALDALTVLHLPARVYETGSVPMQYSFSSPGRFVGLVHAGANGEYVSRFPFSVGVQRHSYGYLGLLAVALLIGAWFYRHSGRVRERLDARRATTPGPDDAGPG